MLQNVDFAIGLNSGGGAESQSLPELRPPVTPPKEASVCKYFLLEPNAHHDPPKRNLLESSPFPKDGRFARVDPTSQAKIYPPYGVIRSGDRWLQYQLALAAT